MEVVISNQYEGGQFVGTNDSYRIQGDYRKDPAVDKVTNLNGSLSIVRSEGDESFIGSVNAYSSGGELKYNLSDISIEYLADAATVVEDLISELEPANS